MFSVAKHATVRRAAAGIFAASLLLAGSVAADPVSGAARSSTAATGRCIWLGISTNYQWRVNASNATSDLPTITRLGVRIIREDILWSVVQPKSASQWNWQSYDALYARASRSNVGILPILGYGTEWASAPKTAQDMPSTSTGQRAYARFAQVFVQRYGKNGVFWRIHPELSKPSIVKSVELWNEPWYAKNPSVRDYVNLVRLAGTAIHTIQPSILVAANADDRWINTPVNGAHFWGQAVLTFNSLLGDTVDRWAIHPYPWPIEGPNTVSDSLRQVLWLRGLLSARRISTQVWVTEIGFESKGKPSADNFTRFITGLNKMTGQNLVSGVVTFTASRPWAGSHPGSWDYGYNLIDSKGAVTPALSAAVRTRCS